jgi:hypothetical protein
MAGIKTTKHLVLTLDGDEASCQLNNSVLSDTSSPEELTSYCATEKVPNPPAYELAIGGWADWGEDGSICDLLHAAYIADPIAEVDAVLTVGKSTRTFTAKPTADLPFGSAPGVQTFETTLSVVGDVTDGTAPTTP